MSCPSTVASSTGSGVIRTIAVRPTIVASRRNGAEEEEDDDDDNDDDDD
jgi:hypothetical protein